MSSRSQDFPCAGRHRLGHQVLRLSDGSLDPLAILFGELLPSNHSRTEPPPLKGKRESLAPHIDQFRCLQKGQGRKFCWTTEPDTASDPQGWFYSFIQRPSGPGAKSGKAKHFVLNRRSLRRHRKQSEAKGRAVELYEEELGEAP